jgi:hypothetical protein
MTVEPAAAGFPHPTQAGDDERLGRVLSAVTLLALVLAAVGAFVPGPVGSVMATAAVVVVVAGPLGRVAWLIGRWWREGDRRFVAAGALLLAIVGTGFVLQLLRG